MAKQPKRKPTPHLVMIMAHDELIKPFVDRLRGQFCVTFTSDADTALSTIKLARKTETPIRALICGYFIGFKGAGICICRDLAKDYPNEMSGVRFGILTTMVDDALLDVNEIGGGVPMIVGRKSFNSGDIAAFFDDVLAQSARQDI